MTCTTIDLDKYEFKNDGCRLRAYDGDHCDLWTDFQSIDAEIIDYGISEDEFEETSPFSKGSPICSTTSSFTTNAQNQESVNASSTPSSSEIRRACVKVVDCDKYPWYYSKYKHQILRRKYLNAVRHARNIVECLKRDMGKQSDVIDDLSDFSENVESNVEEKRIHKQSANKQLPIIDKLLMIEKKCINVNKILENDLKEIIQTQEVNTKKQTITKIDIKKNKGLIGMKVQKVPDNDTRKVNSEVTKKSKKSTKKVKKYKTKHFGESEVQSVDKMLWHTTNSVFDKTQIHKTPNENGDQINIDDKNSKQTNKDNLDKNFGLKCSLQMSPRIFMKITKIMSSEENKSSDNFEIANVAITPQNKDSSVAAGTIVNENQKSEQFMDYRQHLDECNKIKNYKPMPKSKRIALEKYENMDTKQKNPKDFGDQSNTMTEKLRRIPIVKSPTSINKHSMNNKYKSAINLKEKNNETTNKSILHTNKFTEKVLKIVNTNETLNESPQIDHKNERVKEDTGKTKNTLCQKKTSENLEPVQSSLMINVPNNIPRNKCEVPIRYNESKMKQGEAPVSKLLVSNVDKIFRAEKNFDRGDKLSTNKNNKSCDFSSLVQSKENKTLLILQKTLPPEIKPNFEQYNRGVHKSEEHNSSNNNIENERKCNTETNKHYVSQTSSISLLERPTIIPVQLTTEIRHFIRPHGGARFERLPPGGTRYQRPVSGEARFQTPPVPVPPPGGTRYQRPVSGEARFQTPPVPVPPPSAARFQTPLPPPNTRHILNTPNVRPYYHRQIPYTVRPQNSLRRVRPWAHNRFKQPNYANQPGSNNTQGIFENNVNQHSGSNYVQNSHPWPTYSNLSNQEMPYANMPPGICDVQPENWSYKDYAPIFTPSQQPPPSSCQNNSQDNCVIGKNITGLVKKINILNPTHANLLNDVDKKQNIVEQANTNTSTNTKTVNNVKNTISCEDTPISTKSEMMMELEKAMTAIESPVKDLKRPHPDKLYKEQANDLRASRPGPLSKKSKINSQLVTLPQNNKQEPTKGYSPPILPIPTFRTILSEVQAGSNMSVKECERKVSQFNTLNKSLNVGTLECNIPKSTVKNIAQRKPMMNKNPERTKEENIKKISLIEYMARSLKFANEQKMKLKQKTTHKKK